MYTFTAHIVALFYFRCTIFLFDRQTEMSDFCIVKNGINAILIFSMHVSICFVQDAAINKHEIFLSASYFELIMYIFWIFIKCH